MSDESALVARVRNGDHAAFAELIEAYETPIFNLTVRMLGNRSEAEDAAQEVFLRAYARSASYDTRRPFKSWLFAIASHYCIDRLRKRRLTWLSLDEPLPAHPALTDSQPGPEESTLRAEQRELVQQLLGHLKPQDRMMVVLRYWYDFSYAEIGEATNASVGAVKSRLHRARLTLAKVMTERTQAIQPAVLVES